MLDKHYLIERTIAWEKKHPPNTGYMEQAMRAVCSANLPNGANLWTQYAAQFTGKEEVADLVYWDKPERRAPYSNDARLRMTHDGKPDCSSFWYVQFQIFFEISIGTWTEDQYKTLKLKAIPWANRDVSDHVLYNFKASEGRTVSHAANIVLAPNPVTHLGTIGHTRSPSNPFEFMLDAYAASSRVGCYRVLSDDQRLSLIVDDHKTGVTIPSWPTLKYGVKAQAAVMEWKKAMLKIYPTCGLTPTNPNYLTKSVAVTKAFQKDTSHRDETGAVLKVDGIVGPKTRYAIAAHLAKL